jgi:hypothetical protein
MENTNDLLKAKSGNNEQSSGTVEPAKVKIASVVIKDKNKNNEKMQTPLAQFLVKHPDKEELLSISKVKYLDGEKLKTVGFWVNTDEDGNFFKGSAVDIILKKLECETLEDTYGKEIDTVIESETSPYLCLKAY